MWGGEAACDQRTLERGSSARQASRIASDLTACQVQFVIVCSMVLHLVGDFVRMTFTYRFGGEEESAALGAIDLVNHCVGGC